MYDSLVLYTFFVLVIFFLALEIYKFKYYIKGRVIEFYPSAIGLENLLNSQIKVKLENGQVVEAEAERCTICMGEFQLGDEVRLIQSRNKYIVHLPLFFRKQNSCKRIQIKI